MGNNINDDDKNVRNDEQQVMSDDRQVTDDLLQDVNADHRVVDNASTDTCDQETQQDDDPGTQQDDDPETQQDDSSEKTTLRQRVTSADIFKFVGLVAFLVISVIIVILLWPYIRQIFEPGGYKEVANTVKEAGPVGVIILLALQVIQVVVALIPGEVVQIVAGLIYGPWIGGLIIFVGCIASSALVFLLVHKLGAPFVQDIVPEKYMERFNKFEESGRLNIIVFVLFLIPGLPKDVFTYITPLTHMPIGTFLLLTNVARIPGIILSTYAAAGFIEGNIVRSIIIFAVVAAVAIVALLSYNRIMKHFDKNVLKPTNEDSLDTASEDASENDA